MSTQKSERANRSNVPLLVGGLLIAASSTPGTTSGGVSSADGSIRTFESQGQQHIQPGETHPAYNSNPPTSGWHYPSPAEWGIYRDILPDELVVHNLEHGGIWISYRDSTDTVVIQQLETIANSYPSHIIVTYRPVNDTAIAVAAWGHLLVLDTVDEPQIRNFIDLYRMRGPENVP
jgi:hypothetical protein